MKVLLFVLSVVSLPSYGGLQKISVQNLDLEYISPHGHGMVERVGLGMGLSPDPYPIEIRRREDGLELSSSYFDFIWSRPPKMIYEINSLVTKKVSLGLGAKEHYLEAKLVRLETKDQKAYKVEGVKGSCEGEAQGKLYVRILEDCRRKLNLTMKKIDVPESFILSRLVRELPVPREQNFDLPADNLSFALKEGNFSLEMYLKIWVYAGLRAHGHLKYENDYKTIAIRVDQVKFGYLPVTNLVMKKLKEMISSPDVLVDPPWIRIQTRKLYENQ